MIVAGNKTTEVMKARLVDMAWSGVQIEGVGATFAQTKALIENAYETGLSEHDTTVILNLKHAWEHLFEHYEEPITLDTLCVYNAILGAGNIVMQAGSLRGPGEVMVITGDDVYVPRDEVSEDTFVRDYETAIGCAFDSSEAAAALFLLLSRAQYFHDGNKRTALLLANHFLAHEDAGMALTMTKEQRDWLYDELVSFYTGDLSLQDASFDVGGACVHALPSRGLHH